MFEAWGFLLECGFNAQESFGILVEYWPSGRLKTILKAVYQSMALGHPLGYSFSSYPSIFSPTMVELLQVAQPSSQLPLVVGYLSNYCRKLDQSQQQFRRQLYYVSGLFLFVLVIIVIMHWWILPELQSFLPINETQVITNTDWTIGNIVLIGTFFAGLGGFISCRHRWISHLPWWPKWCVVRYAPGLLLGISMLLRGGVPLLQAFKAGVYSVHSPGLQRFLLKGLLCLEGSGCLATALEPILSPYPFLVSTIHYGQQSGQLCSVLEKNSQFLLSIYDRYMVMVMSIFQPLCLLVIGGLLWWTAQQVLDVSYSPMDL